MPASVAEPALYQVSEVAARLRLHRLTVYRWINEGRLPAKRLGPHGPIRVSGQDVEALLRSSEARARHAVRAEGRPVEPANDAPADRSAPAGAPTFNEGTTNS